MNTAAARFVVVEPAPMDDLFGVAAGKPARPEFLVREPAGTYRAATPDDLIGAGQSAAAARCQPGKSIDSPSAARDFLRLTLGTRDHEVFAVLFLDAQHRVIEFREMFRGSLTQTSVYPREVVKAALELNAAACLLSHNHPSGATDPSRADEHMTQTLKTALALVDVRVIDHVIVSATGSTSFAERGLI